MTRLFAAFMFAVLACGMAAAEDYPSRPVTIITTNTAESVSGTASATGCWPPRGRWSSSWRRPPSC